MSWSIYVTGTKAGVKRKVEEATGYGDQSQLEAAKAFILAEIEALPEAVNGVSVKAGGHHDERSRNLNIDIQSVLIEV